MIFHILTLFPEMFPSVLNESILKRAQEKGVIEVKYYNIRDYSEDKHRRVDDMPYGGGAGMLMTCQPLFKAIESVKSKVKSDKCRVIYFSPGGEKFIQEKSEKFAEECEEIILICGHYEGIDQRVIDTFVDEEISIGDYVLTGGEIPAMVFVDTVARLIPDVLGKNESYEEESFSKKLDRKKEYPHYTRPAEFQGMKVPEVLLNGHHAEIEKWRRENLR